MHSFHLRQKSITGLRPVMLATPLSHFTLDRLAMRTPKG
jgi:hypothetical protein